MNGVFMRRLIFCCALVCALPVMALAVGTSHWVHTTEADFKAGKFENVVATNLGDLKLSRAVKMLLEQDPKVSSVYALAEGKDGTIFAGTGPEGVLLAISGEKVSTVLTLKENESIFSLCVDHEGRVLMGTGGDKGRVLRLDKVGETPKEIFAPEGVQYVWALVETPDGNVYAATGPKGQLFELTPDGSHHVVMQSDEHNLLALLSDGKDMLYVGTDPHGLVYRVNRKTRDAFVMYDAGSEVSALAMDEKGNLYAGTAAASAVTEGAGEDLGANEKGGRPEGATGGVPIPSSPPAEPNPPELPPTNPGEPAPIPKAHNKRDQGVKKMVILAEDGDDQEKPSSGEKPSKPGKPKPMPLPGMEKSSAKRGAEKSKGLTPLAQGKSLEPAEKGNAIYRIDPDGFVTEIFRQPVLVMSLLEQNGKLLVGTGSDGTVYQVDPDAEETVALAKVDPKQVMTLMAAKDGRVYMGLANVGSIAAMSHGYASDGTYTSPVLDATQVSRFGKVHLRGSLPEGAELKVSTRSGNIESQEDKGWSAWTEPVAASQYLPIASPSARFFQYRLMFSSKVGVETPVVDEVDVAYQIPNLAPQIKTVKITPGSAKAPVEIPAAGEAAPKGPKSVMTVTWDANDPNDDAMQYTLYYRMGSKGKWILLKDKLKEASFEWETKSVADGPYFLKVVASDAAANAVGMGRTGSRVSDPVFIDNTPPVIGDLSWQKMAGGVKVRMRAIDRASTVASVEYSVDSNSDWQAVFPSDSIFDAPEEEVSFSATGLTVGQHQLTIRATDAHGNQAFESLLVTVAQ